jgi:putative phage-type endonuclease
MALTKAQLEERRSGIGGSDAAVILGLNPFKDVYGLYLDKRGEAPEEDPNFLKESRYWGSVLEQPVADRYAEETGYKIQKSNQLIRSKEHPFMIANIDRKVVGEERRIGFEAKTAARADGWGDSGSAEIPPYIMLQCQHYLAVTGYDLWDLAVLIGNRDFRMYRITPIQHIIDTLVEAEQEFWDRVEHGVAPEPDWQSAATTRLLKDLYPGTNGQVIQLPDVAQKYQDVMDDAMAQRRIFDDVVTGCKNRLAMLMGECAVGLLPDETAITRKEVTRKEYTVAETSYIDTRRVKKLPKLATDAIEAGTVLSHDAKVMTLEKTDDD